MVCDDSKSFCFGFSCATPICCCQGATNKKFIRLRITNVCFTVKQHFLIFDKKLIVFYMDINMLTGVEMNRLPYLAIKLREARKKAQLSAKEAGDIVDRSERTIFLWESGKTEPNAEQLITLCKAYGVDITFFFPPELTKPENLNNVERTIIERYRELNPDDKAVLYGLLEILGKK